MQIQFYGMVFATPRVSFYLWSPWRASALENRMFDAVQQFPGELETVEEETRFHVADADVFQQAIQKLSRILKGWQEDADPGRENRLWRWLFEGDTDAHGYDHSGQPTSLWIYLRLSIDRGGLGEPEKGEDIDLNGFGMRIWQDNKR